MNNKGSTHDKKVVSFIPSGDFYFKKAIKSLQRERTEEAQKFLKRAAELSPTNPEILMNYGVVVMEEGRFDEALELLLVAHEHDPNEEEIIFYLAEVHAHLGLLRDAKAYAKKYVSLDPDGPLADEAMGIIDFAEQEDALYDEDETREEELNYLLEKSRRLMESEDFKAATELLESVIENNPTFWAAYNNLALAYFYIGQTEKANELLHKVLKLNNGNLHALCNLAVFYYYEKKEEELEALLDLLMKIKPFVVENRYKLGATFALVGQHKEAFYWLRSLQKYNFEGDTGYYFWLSQSAYFSGHEDIAHEAYAKLIELDASKEGYEPWKGVEPDLKAHSLEQDRDFLLGKIRNAYRSERMFGFYLLGKSGHKQEIISHPSYIDVDKLSPFEQLFLASGLEYEFMPKTTFDKSFIKALETTELLYENYRPLDRQATHLFQMWFTLCENALTKSYPFQNPRAIAAAADYMFQSARYAEVTKTALAKEYGISIPTLTKYVNELIEFLPHFDGV